MAGPKSRSNPFQLAGPTPWRQEHLLPPAALSGGTGQLPLISRNVTICGPNRQPGLPQRGSLAAAPAGPAAYGYQQEPVLPGGLPGAISQFIPGS